MLICQKIIPCLWLVFVVVWLIASFGVKRSVRGGHYLRYAALRVFIFFLISYIWQNVKHGKLFGIAERGTTIPALSIAGVAVCALSIGFAFWARFSLGKNWGAPMSVKQNPELVTSGPYAYVRHPIYSAILLAIVATSVVCGTVWLIIFFVTFLYFYRSALTEEKNMTAAFPDQYHEYRRRTKMLIPFVV